MGAQWKHKWRVAEGARKGALFTRLTKEIIIAAKAGDPDPAHNARLRAAIEAARRQSMPRENIERSIKKGAGLLEPVNYETVIYEGYAPHQVPVIVECLTDNKNRTAAEIRVLFRKGQLGTGVQWLYNRAGVVEATHDKSPDPEEAAIEAGAQEVEREDDLVRFYTEPADLGTVTAALSEAGWTVSASELRWIVKDPVALEDGPAKDEVMAFLEALDGYDDVQRLHVGLA